MKQNEDISILITNKAIQKIITNWSAYNKNAKSRVCRDYNLNLNDVEILKQLRPGLDSKKNKLPQKTTIQALQEIIWKLEKRNKTITKLNRSQFYNFFIKITTQFIISLISFTLYILHTDSENQTKKNSNQLIAIKPQAGTLPNGSEVLLNAISSIPYPSHFAINTRNIKLARKEYFKVAKNKQIPIIAPVNNLNLKTYNTTFTSNANASETLQKVTLIQRCLLLSSQLQKFNGQDELFITPEQTATCFNKTKILNIQKTDTYSLTAWKKGVLVFRYVTIESMIKQLLQKYAIKIELKEQRIGSIRMNTVFLNENINEGLRLLSLITNFKYSYASSVKLQDGSLE